MKYSEIIENESRLSQEKPYEIRFYREGEWWRAYEWSAYLAYFFPNGLEEKNRIRPTRKPLKGFSDGYVFIGMKLASFSKYLPSMDVMQIDESYIAINARSALEGKVNLNNAEHEFLEWKCTIPIKEAKDCGKRENKPINSREDILDKIVNFQFENKSLIEIATFLSNIRERILNAALH